MLEYQLIGHSMQLLAEHVTSLPDDAVFIAGFDASVLSIRCEEKLIAVAGQGLPWIICFRFKVTARALRRFTKRLSEERVGLSI